MNEFSNDGAIIDAKGRRTAGRNMGVLAREYRELRQQLDSILANGCGLSHEEISVPYAKLATNLRAKLARIADDLEHAGSEQRHRRGSRSGVHQPSETSSRRLITGLVRSRLVEQG